MKLEVGMICRTYEGYIGKLIQINVSDYNYLVIDCNRDVRRDVGYPKSHLYLKEENIKKASYDILDLIEVGDILHNKNDDEYWTVQETQGTGYIQTEWEVVETQEEFFEIFDEIITKEQAKEFSYKIGE